MYLLNASHFVKHGVRMSESLSDTSMVNYTWLKNSAAF